jgi:hypothetical protein
MQKAAAREERVQKLVENLRHKLGIFTENATSVNDPEVAESWRTICALEAECVSYKLRSVSHSLNFSSRLVPEEN